VVRFLFILILKKNTNKIIFLIFKKKQDSFGVVLRAIFLQLKRKQKIKEHPNQKNLLHRGVHGALVSKYAIAPWIPGGADCPAIPSFAF
jgi:hypothetical protein